MQEADYNMFENMYTLKVSPYYIDNDVVVALNVTHVKCRRKVFPLCTIKTYKRNKAIALSILNRNTS